MWKWFILKTGIKAIHYAVGELLKESDDPNTEFDIRKSSEKILKKEIKRITRNGGRGR